MSKKGIQNAEQIIEAFGGIRPMAKKLEVAVTTVQGWKKRNVIPAARRDAIVQAAKDNDVDLGDLLDTGQANDIKPDEDKNQDKATEKSLDNDSDNKDEGDALEGDSLPEVITTSEELDHETKLEKVDATAITENTTEPPQKTAEEKILEQQLSSSDDKNCSGSYKFSLILAIAVILGFLAIAAYFWQKSNAERAAEAARLAELERQRIEAEQLAAAEAVKNEQGFLGNIIPKDLNEKLNGLQEQAEDLQAGLSATAQIVKEKAKAVSDDVLAEEAGNLEQRLQKLNIHIQDITGKPVLAGMLSRIENLQISPEGNEFLAQTVVELNTLFENLKSNSVQDFDTDDPSINATIDAARQDNETLGHSLKSVPQEDLKAAAILLGMAQLRSALNRDNAAFENDLLLLKQTVGDDNQELLEALDRLSPHAKSGVLTLGGLSNEFRSFAGDAVAASLTGEDVSVQERAKARMNELFSVTKDGELITGTDTQAALVEAEQKLQNGQIEGAIQVVEGMDNRATEVFKPWLGKARATLDAQKAKSIVADTISGYTTGGKLIRNEELGINIYTPKKPVTD